MRAAIPALFLSSVLADSPVDRVVTLLRELKSKIEADGTSEQEAYDKFQCWCEKTIGETSKAITDGKASVETLSETITTKKGELGSLSADLDHVKKSLADNLKSQKEAVGMRHNQHQEYSQKKNEMEEAIGALQNAVKVLEGAGTGADLLTVAADVRGALGLAPKGAVSSDQLSTVDKFLRNPGSFAQSAASLRSHGVDPHGPASGEISGILRDMYETFVSDLQQANEEEAEQRKLHEELMAAKQKEQSNLEASLDTKEGDHADATEVEASSKEERLETEKNLKVNEKFFVDTKSECQIKAHEWAQRSLMRNQELKGIEKAIEILDDDDAKSRFEQASSTFLQTQQSNQPHTSSAVRDRVFRLLSAVSRRSKRVSIALLSADVSAGWHFDKVVANIDKLIQQIRKEERDDVAAKDICDEDKAKHEGKKADLDHNIDTLAGKNTTVVERKDAALASITELETKISAVNGTLTTLITERNSQHESFQQGLEDDEEAIKLLDKAIEALKDYYRTHPAMVAKAASVRRHAEEPGEKPRADFAKGDAKKTESDQIIGMMEMIKQDLQNEIKHARSDEKHAVDAFWTQHSELLHSIRDMQGQIADLEKRVAGFDKKIAALQEDIESDQDSRAAVEAAEEKVEPSCSWLEGAFEKRREARRTELDGLNSAKAALQGAVEEAAADTLFVQRKPLLSK
mmetsp:Transcript_40677/g.97552  ORF Transcript_40677/g.97552 Transcript_40677/m.97552 type:complete len:689 (+) Transcript_40677:95-2161(+)